MLLKKVITFWSLQKSVEKMFDYLHKSGIFFLSYEMIKLPYSSEVFFFK